MRLRDRIFLSTSALLYLGPLFAGLSGYGFGAVPLFTVLFLLWLERMRPMDWPRSRADWAEPRRIAWIILIVFCQAGLVAFCLIAGHGIAAMSAFRPPLPLAFALILSMLAIATANLMRRAEEGPPLWRQGMGFCVGAGILWMPGPGEIGITSEEALDTARDALAELPEAGATRAELAPVLDFARREGIEEALIGALVRAPADHLPNVQAMIALALRPEIARRIAGRGWIAHATASALGSRVPALMQKTAHDLERLLPAVPELAQELPPPVRLTDSADEIERVDPFAARALRSLAATRTLAEVA